MADSADAPLPEPVHRHRVYRLRLSEEDRRSAMDALMLRPSAGSVRRYSVLLILSVVVAAVGLVQNSAAVVIGAMMIAPLMSPILGLAASLVMGWRLRLVNGAVLVAASVAAAVAIAGAIASFLPETGLGLPAEVLARTSPDVRDLLVALAAGAAGAYATVRRDISGALPGVAVAVALVPPLADVGVLLGRGQPQLAWGAALLFATNLFGILLAAAVVFVVTGFVPPYRFAASRPRVLLTIAVVSIPTVVFAVFLTTRFVRSADAARDLRLANSAVAGLLSPGDTLNRVAVAGNKVQVSITGTVAPPNLQTLTTALGGVLARPVTVDLLWTPEQTATQAPTPAPTLALDLLRPVVEQWLAGQSLSLDGLSYEAGTLVVSASGAQPPKSSTDLATLIDHAFGTRPVINLAWTRAADSGPATANPNALADIAQATADSWAAGVPGVAVLAVQQSDTAVTVTVIAAERPETADLQSALRLALPQASITVDWVSGSLLAHSEPSPTPTSTGPTPTGSPTSTPVPTPSPS